MAEQEFVVSENEELQVNTAPEEDTEGFGETEESEKEDDEKLLCPRCGMRNVAKGREYCYRCEEELSHTKFPIIGMIASLLALAASVFCFAIVCLDAAPALEAVKGDAAYARRNLYGAYNAYNEVDTSAKEITDILGENSPLNIFVKSGLGLKLKQFKVVAGIYDPLRTYQRQDVIFGDISVDEKYLEKDKTYAYCKQHYERFERTYKVLQEPLDMMNEMQDITRENGETMLALVEEKRGEEGVDEVILDYIIYTINGYYSMGADAVLESLEELDKVAKQRDEDYSWLYYKDYARVLLSNGKADEAMPYIDTLAENDISAYDPALYKFQALMIKGDKESAEKVVDKYVKENRNDDYTHSDSNYSLLINAARAKGNYDEALELIDEAKSLYPNVPEYDRQLALIHLVKGEYDEAYEAAYQAEQTAYNIMTYYGDAEYFSSRVLMSTVYLSAVMCKEKGKADTENAQYLDEVIKSYDGAELNPYVKKIIDGEADIKDVLTKGACDLL